MNKSELLKTIDAHIAEAERRLNFLQEQRRFRFIRLCTPYSHNWRQVQGSCGKFYLDKTKASNEKSSSENNKTKKV